MDTPRIDHYDLRKAYSVFDDKNYSTAQRMAVLKDEFISSLEAYRMKCLEALDRAVKKSEMDKAAENKVKFDTAFYRSFAQDVWAHCYVDIGELYNKLLVENRVNSMWFRLDVSIDTSDGFITIVINVFNGNPEGGWLIEAGELLATKTVKVKIVKKVTPLCVYTVRHSSLHEVDIAFSRNDKDVVIEIDRITKTFRFENNRTGEMIERFYDEIKRRWCVRWSIEGMGIEPSEPFHVRGERDFTSTNTEDMFDQEEEGDS